MTKINAEFWDTITSVAFLTNFPGNHYEQHSDHIILLKINVYLTWVISIIIFKPQL